MTTKPFLEVGLNDRGEVVISHPFLIQNEQGGHLIFTPEEASHFGLLMLQKATEAAAERGDAAGSLPDGAHWPLTASETLYSFAAWLTTRDEAVTLGATHDASVAADLVNEFCQRSGIPDPRENFGDLLKRTPSMATS